MRFAVKAALLAAALTAVVVGQASASSSFYIRGGGDGHGIGMSQYGAYGYALHGKTYDWILAHYYQGTSLGTTNPARFVRVLLASGSAGFSGATKAGTRALNPSMTYYVRALADGSLELVDQPGHQVGRFPAPLTASGPGPLHVAGLGAYRGALQFRPNGAGGVLTVDAIGLDDYVRGVISAEMPASWSPEALKVQAVAARTYAITTNVGGGSFDLYPDTRSQMYRGVAAETPSTNAAVAATSGQVVTYRGVPVVTYFFNSSGGHTESIENVWIGSHPEPWLRGVPDPYDDAGGDPYHRWGYDLTVPAAAARLGRWVKGQLVGIQVTRHGLSPRILTADVVGTRGRTHVTGTELQQAFGLYTTWASFTTISSVAGSRPGTSRDGGAARAPRGAEAMAALIPLVHQLISGVPVLRGSVFPGARGARFDVQQRGGHGWRTVANGRLGGNGAYSVDLPGPGTYRIAYQGLDGPAVSAG